jgi:hypothetical protein
MIVAHHGGELSLLQAALVSAGSLPVLLLLLRKEIGRLGRRLRHRPDAPSIPRTRRPRRRLAQGVYFEPHSTRAAEPKGGTNMNMRSLLARALGLASVSLLLVSGLASAALAKPMMGDHSRVSGVLTLAAGAHATPPQSDAGPVVRQQPATGDGAGVCSSGHGPQFDCDDTSAPAGPATGPATSPSPGRQPVPVPSLVAGLTLLLAATAGGIWLRLRQRPRGAI